jgi:aquaporin Z
LAAKDFGRYGTTPLPAAENILTSRANDAFTSLEKRCICEFLGTLFLFLAVACCSNALYIAVFYVGLVYTFWFLSGSHFNPAISVAVTLARKMPLDTCLYYVVSQTAGACVGGFITRIILQKTLTLAPISPYTLADGIFIEILYTSMLTFVALQVIHLQRNDRNEFFGIAVGFVMLAGGAVTQKISTATLFNPAFSLGVMTSTFNFASCFCYAVAELASAIIGFGLFRICRSHDDMRESDSTYELEQGISPVVQDAPHGSSLATRMLSEFVGTFYLVSTICLNTAVSTGYTAWSGAAVLISMLYALSGTCDGHLNPAVTLAVMLDDRNKCSKMDGCGYVAAQLLSAIPAGLVGISIAKNGGLFAASSTYSWFPIGLIEFIFTLALVYIVLVLTTSEKHTYFTSVPNYYFALVIGFAFQGFSHAAGDISGGYLNPAVALGFAVDGATSMTVAGHVLQDQYFAAVYHYWVPEFCGAALAALLFYWSHEDEFAKVSQKWMPTIIDYDMAQPTISAPIVATTVPVPVMVAPFMSAPIVATTAPAPMMTVVRSISNGMPMTTPAHPMTTMQAPRITIHSAPMTTVGSPRGGRLSPTII